MPLQNGDLALIKVMVNDRRICNESMENLDGMFRYCFLIVGLREKNFPNELETLFLHEFVKENYGGHSTEEIKMAFRMAIKSELDLKEDEVTCYENFSVRYISNILNSYRRWAAQEFKRLEQHIQPSDEDVKYLEVPRQEIHWGSLIEKSYQHFLSFGEEGWRTFPVAFYEQLVKDDLVNAELFRKAMPIVRKKLIGEIQKDKAVLQMRRFDADDVEKSERLQYHKSANELKIQEITKTTEDYLSGEKDGELEVCAKQYCVLQFFKNSKQSFKQNVYVPAE